MSTLRCWKYNRMKLKTKKTNLIIEGKKEDGYSITLPANQRPRDFHMSFDELLELYQILHKYFTSPYGKK